MNQQSTDTRTPPTSGEGIGEFFTQHYKSALLTAQRILRSREDSEDAVQTAYCAALQRIDTFRGDSSFNTWITRIVVNVCFMQLRKRRASVVAPLDEVAPVAAPDAPTPETLCYERELRDAHVTAVSRLPPTLRDVYAPCVMSEVALPIITKDLGLTGAAVKSRLFRARRRVEESLRPVAQSKAA